MGESATPMPSTLLPSDLPEKRSLWPASITISPSLGKSVAAKIESLYYFISPASCSNLPTR